MAEKTLPLGKDPALEDPSGMNPADVSDSSVAIENTPGNADQTVKLDADMEDVGGVEIAKELEEEFYDPAQKTQADINNHD